MKHFIFIGLFALALSLGVGCKKETVTVPANEISKTELHAPDANLKPSTLGLENPDGPGGPGGTPSPTYNPSQFPHSTGVCACSGCNGYYWNGTNKPLHKSPCQCYMQNSEGNDIYVPAYVNGSGQSGCNFAPGVM